MKQWTTTEQTAKLIELGLTDSIREERYKRGALPKNYSIGELIEILPNTITIDETTYSKVVNKNEVFYYSWVFGTYALLICDINEDLVDNLFDMCVQLKDKGVI